MNNVDPNVVAANIVTDLTKTFFSGLAKKSINFLNGTYSYLFPDFNTYLESTYLKCNELKIIINKSRHYTLDEIYVSSTFQCGGATHQDEELIQRARDCERFVVTGFGGIGKTIFSKRLWSSVFAESQGKIPIFFELRQLNTITDVNLLAHIRVSLSSYSHSLDEETFDKFVIDGRFLFIFDGFDELPESKREIVEKQILEISRNCLNCGLVVSGRFNERFNSWERFRVYKALPFDKAQVINLLEKVEFEKKVKAKFLTEIVGKRFSDYQSFLETPLLALMMLMTFAQSGEVPDKKSVFYKYAFLALYSWHDGSKEAFKRESKTGLDIDQFQKVFSIFCLLTYVEFQFQISRSKFIETLEKCKNYVEFKYDCELYLNECVESVNLLYCEGDEYIFTHRSFQEYYCAYACVNFFHAKLPELTDRLMRSGDSVLSLMNELNDDVVDSYIIYEEGRSKIDELKQLTRIRNSTKFLEKLDIIYTQRVVITDSKVRNYISGTVVRHINNSFWNKVLELKKDQHKDLPFEVPTILDIGSKKSDEIINAIREHAKEKIDKIKSKSRKQTNSQIMIEFTIQYWRNSLYYNVSEDAFGEFGEIYENPSKFDCINLDVDLSDWAIEVMENTKPKLVFALKRIEGATKRVKSREKSIDDILGI